MTLKSDKSLALLALALDDKKPQGIKPTLLEIDLWQQGKFNEKRRAEIQSYIAHDTETYKAWVDLLETEQILEDEIKHTVKEPRKNTPVVSIKSKTGLKNKLGDWAANLNNHWVGGGLAFATAACLIVAVSLKTVMQPSLISGIEGDYARFSGNPQVVHWYYQSYDKSLDFSLPNIYDELKPATLYGIHEGLVQLQTAKKLAGNETWNEVIAMYPDVLPVCPDKISAQDCQK